MFGSSAPATATLFASASLSVSNNCYAATNASACAYACLGRHQRPTSLSTDGARLWSNMSLPLGKNSSTWSMDIAPHPPRRNSKSVSSLDPPAYLVFSHLAVASALQ
jgi:hypothetical protein